MLHFALTLYALTAGPQDAPQDAPAPLPTQELIEADAAVFGLMFDACDPEALSRRVTDDLEFYHDKGGASLGKARFIADYAQGCRARQAPDAWRSRRELVTSTLQMHSIPGTGVITEVTHRFYERQGDGPETLVGQARFSILWTRSADGPWQMSRVFSIDHRPASAD